MSAPASRGSAKIGLEERLRRTTSLLGEELVVRQYRLERAADRLVAAGRIRNRCPLWAPFGGHPIHSHEEAARLLPATNVLLAHGLARVQARRIDRVGDVVIGSALHVDGLVVVLPRRYFVQVGNYP